MNLTFIKELTFSYFFGAEALKYEDLLDKLINCHTSKQFNTMAIDMESPTVDLIFSNASRKDTMVLSPSKEKDTFLKLKSVRGNVDFI